MGIHRIHWCTKDGLMNYTHIHYSIVGVLCFVEEEQEPPTLHQPCSLLVTCDERQVDLHLFQAINKVYFTLHSALLIKALKIICTWEGM